MDIFYITKKCVMDTFSQNKFLFIDKNTIDLFLLIYKNEMFKKMYFVNFSVIFLQRALISKILIS